MVLASRLALRPTPSTVGLLPAAVAMTTEHKPTSERDLHERLMDAGQRAMTHDLRPWTMLDESGERVGSPCCDADWLDPILFSAQCANCAQPWDATPLGIVKGVR
jgi:hypothetical protein